MHLNKLPCFTIKEKRVYHPGKQHLGIYYQYPLVTDQGLTPFTLGSDLAQLYGVTTGNLNKAVKRNISRFPNDFMFQLTADEYKSLRFRFGIFKKGQHSKYLPYAFTEQGVAMLSSILRSKRAIEVNIAIMRAFVRLREMFATHMCSNDGFSRIYDEIHFGP